MTSLRLAAPFAGSESWIDALLNAVSIQSMMDGRIRFHLGFQIDELLGDSIRREINKVNSAKLASFSVRTRNVLVTFDPKEASELQVATAVLRGVKGFARLHGECDLEHHHHEKRRPAHSETGKTHSHGHGQEDCD